jgi:hypothetical protein
MGTKAEAVGVTKGKFRREHTYVGFHGGFKGKTPAISEEVSTGASRRCFRRASFVT